MRKAILLGALLTLFLPLANAQLTTGTVMMGGNSGIGITKNSFNLNMNPRVGYFIAPDLVIGGDVNTNTRFSSDAGSTNFDFNYDVGVFMRYYLSPGKKWRPFLHAELDNIPVLGRFNGAAGAGIAYFIHPKVSIETQLLFRVNSIFEGPNFAVSGLNVGFHVFLPTKKKK